MPSGAVVDRDVAVPMRDGTLLRADVYRPASASPVPVVVSRLPYDRSHPLVPSSALDPERAVEAGFAVVCQDNRGRFSSDGRFRPFQDDGRDGYDTVEWAAAQPWSNGAVGMAGRSYGGAVQWLAAAEQPPHLKAMVPVVIGSDFFDNWIYQGGAFQLGFNLFWALLITSPREASRALAHARHLPLASLPIPREKGADFFFEWLEHPTNDAFWQALAINRSYGQIHVPAYNVGGWYDVFLAGTLENFVRMRREGGSEAARRGQKLLVGPWGHGSTYGPYPDHSFPQFAPGDAADLAAEQIRFFGRYLKEERNGIDEEPPVQIFVMGENRWRNEPDWPLARARPTPFYLHGPRSTDAGRVLSAEPPGRDEAPDAYTYDPGDPAPTVGGSTSLPALLFGTNSGPQDQKRVEARPDVLVYTSEPLSEPLEVTGPLSVVLFAATSAPDTDFVAKLTDVDLEGVSRILAEGILRARYREGFEHPRPVDPGQVYTYTIDLVATANVFRAGHRIRVAITSSSFPRFDANPNTGHALGVDGPEDLRRARQTIFHDQARPSHILLPVVRR